MRFIIVENDSSRHVGSECVEYITLSLLHRVTLITSHGSFIHNDGIAVAATSDLMT